MAKVLALTEFTKVGSGYTYLMSPILQGMTELGHDVKIIGLSYDGSEHHYNFSAVPAATVQDSVAIAQNIVKLWNPDIFLCGLDIPLQIQIKENLKDMTAKYIAITPLENPPLTQTWAAYLFMLDWVFFISELGRKSAEVAGLSKVDHIQVGVDSVSNKPPTPEHRKKLREDLGLDKDFVILTVADNQERKNLWAALQIVSNLKSLGEKVKFLLVTRENSPVGYKLRDLCTTLDINKEVLITERGIPLDELWKLYASADIYLSTSKAEGLGLPVLEAMACGLPVVATDTGALSEVLADGRGYLIEPEYTFTDVWGNSRRDMISIASATNTIQDIIKNPHHAEPRVKQARAYAETRTFEIPVIQVHKKIEELLNEK